MARNKESSQVVDALLLALSMGAVTGAMLVAPNAVQMLEKPLEKMFGKLDERQRQRKLIRMRSYLKTQGLVRGDYCHGLELTKKALKRIRDIEYKNLAIDVPKTWDGRWRIVMFDIPEDQKHARLGFTEKIRSMGFQLLQLSVWIHPFECKDKVFVVSSHYDVSEWVTYIETTHIDNDKALRRRFKYLLN